MTSKDFTDLLRAYFELADPNEGMTPNQVAQLKSKLNSVSDPEETEEESE